MKLLEGKTAIITGASKGIGKGIAQKFVEQGANVAFTYLSSVEKGQALEQELSQDGITVKGYRSDVPFCVKSVWTQHGVEVVEDIVFKILIAHLQHFRSTCTVLILGREAAHCRCMPGRDNHGLIWILGVLVLAHADGKVQAHSFEQHIAR